MSTREQLIKARMGMLSLSAELKNIAKALCLLKIPSAWKRSAQAAGGFAIVRSDRAGVRPRRLSAC